MTWTHFWDMNSGGGHKEDVGHIFIEAPENEATSVFYARFGHNPNCVTCTCCGPDYSISEDETIEQATAFQRNCAHENGKYVERRSEHAWGEYMTVEQFEASGDAMFIRADEIADDERTTDVPTQGYVWAD